VHASSIKEVNFRHQMNILRFQLAQIWLTGLGLELLLGWDACTRQMVWEDAHITPDGKKGYRLPPLHTHPLKLLRMNYIGITQAKDKIVFAVSHSVC